MNQVFFLTCGFMEVGALWTDAPGRRRGQRRLSLTVGVMIRPNRDVVLVDVGWSAETCAEPRKALGLWYWLSLGVRVSRGQAVVDQLAALGIDRSRVKTVVPTHLHLDHINGVRDFPDAEVVCTEPEWRAWQRRPRGLGYRAGDLSGGGRIRPVALTSPARLGFPASWDVFEDGSVVLLDAPGHTRGHAAVALSTATRLYVHTGDAADQSWEWRGGYPSLQGRLIAWNVKQLKSTYGYLRACEADPAAPVLVAAHDDEIFQTLPHAPQGGAFFGSSRLKGGSRC